MKIAVFLALSGGKLSINSQMGGEIHSVVDALGVRLSNRSASAATEGELQQLKCVFRPFIICCPLSAISAAFMLQLQQQHQQHQQQQQHGLKTKLLPRASA